jgi:cystathionine beta-lyase/cystathionine gamma-synthase
MAFVINAAGNALTPFDCFLLLRGTKTLAIRMDRQQTTAMLVAQMLDRLGFKVHYPGLANHPNRDVHERIAHGFGAVLSFTTGDKALSERIVGATALWGISVSFGCVNSLISMPCVMSYVFYVSFSSTLLLIFSPVDTRLLTLLRVLLVASRRT